MGEGQYMSDLINACFELSGGCIILLNVRQLYKDKELKGFHWGVLLFFTVWGYWNLYYYPHLQQWLSFIGGISVVSSNTIYLSMVIYYMIRSNKERQQVNETPK